MEMYMLVDVKRAFMAPFNDRRSLCLLAIGFLISLPGAWQSLHPGAPLWIQLVGLVLDLATVGYAARVMVSEYANGRQGLSSGLPSPLGRPWDMIVAVPTGAVAVFVCLVFWAVVCLAAMVFAAALLTPEQALAATPIVQGVLAIAMYFAMLFACLMFARHTYEQRFLAIFEWDQIGQICSAARVSIFVLPAIAAAILYGASWLTQSLFVARAFVDFYGLVVFANFMAQLYANAARRIAPLS
jgi:hypothetical protein